MVDMKEDIVGRLQVLNKMRGDHEWSPEGQPTEKFKRTRTTREQAQKEQKKVWRCQRCGKEYQSYPALYTHTKQKHSGQDISSKGKEDNNGHAPVKKLKSILSETNSPLEELERSLIKSAKSTCLCLYELLSKQFGVTNQDVGFVWGLPDLNPLLKQAERLAVNKQLPQRLVPSMESPLMAEEEIRVGKVSFGREVLGFFSRSALAGQLCLQLGAIESVSRGEGTMGEWQQRIWGMKINFRWLLQEWEAWTSIVARLRQQQPAGRRGVAGGGDGEG